MRESPASEPEPDERRSAPAFALPATDGGTAALADVLAGGGPALVAFVDEGCAPCERALAHLARRQREGATVLLVGGGDPDAVAALAAEHGARLGLDPDGRVGDLYGVRATPSACLVDPDGTTGRLAVGEDAVRALASRSP